MLNNSFSRAVWKISLPIIFVEATETFDHLIDTLFLARVGVTELGAIAVADAVMLLCLVLPLGLVDGIQILTARRVGQRRPAAVGDVFNQGLLLVLLVCTVFTAGLKLLSPFVTAWFVESAHVGNLVDGYLQIDAYSIGLAGATFAFSALLTSLGRTRALIPATIILVVTDLTLNYLFIFGKFGCPALGMRGAAVGSVGAELLTVVFLAVYVWRAFDREQYGFFRFHKVERRTKRLLSLLSAPIAAQGVVEELRWFLFFLIFERLGTGALAIANIVYTCYAVICIPTEGFSETCCSMVGRFVGRNQVERIGSVIKNTIGGALLATLPFILVAVLAPRWLLAVFAPDPDLLGPSIASLRVIALAMLIAIPAEMWSTAVLGTGDTAASLGIELVLLLVMVGLTYLAAIQFALPLVCVWLAPPVSWLVCLALSYGWMKSGIWKRLEI